MVRDLLLVRVMGQVRLRIRIKVSKVRGENKKHIFCLKLHKIIHLPRKAKYVIK